MELISDAMTPVQVGGTQEASSPRDARVNRSRWVMQEGRPFPMGVSWNPEWQAYNFALCAPHASEVKLLFFTETEITQTCAVYTLDYSLHKSGDIWHCLLKKSSLNGAMYYAYSVAGPADAFRGGWHAYDPDKLLLDPYARNVYFPPGFEREAAIGAGSNIGRAPLAKLIADEEPFDWSGDVAPRYDGELVIYEMHVRGFTRHASSQVAPTHRGTFAGVIEKVPYLRDLGITAVELMPVFQFEPGPGDYWGYMPLNFFAPHHLYGSVAGFDHQHREFKQMVRELHRAGIEVILDVVYNHTAEGNEFGPTYSLKGIDNAIYYLPSQDSPGAYANYSGTGNSLRCANRYVRQLILDSMRFWVTQMHVDGFRFDLASVLVRNEAGQIDGSHPALLAEMRADPILGQVRLIAEPWDAQGGYLLGRRLFPGTQWAQWNDRYRDDVRRFIRGDKGLIPAMQYRLYGSDDLFPPGPEYACHPYQSINFVNCHDGFTLYDLLSYNVKHNEANGQSNTDGANDNWSWNCGWEGDQDLPADVLRLRLRQAKNFCCLLMLSNGTPMFRAGDEFLQTQGGNNNPYNQDNATNWLDWNRLERFASIHDFFRRMIAFRRRHPAICRSRFWGEDVRWYGTSRVVDQSYESRSLAYSLRGSSQGDDDLYIMINMWEQPLNFQIQEGQPGHWRIVVDTAQESPCDLWSPEHEAPVVCGLNHRVEGRSIVVLKHF